MPAKKPAPAPAPAPEFPVPGLPPNLGPMVLVRIGGEDGAPELRPAAVVKAWSATAINALVFLDGSNDDHHGRLQGEITRHGWIAWCTSIVQGDAVGQWRAVP